jgi:hypothetical protein
MIPNAKPRQPAELRRHRRYRVNGSVVLVAGERRYAGVPENVSLGGILFKANPMPDENTQGTLRLEVDGFEPAISAEARVVRTYETAAAAVFLIGSRALVQCVGWLAKQEAEPESSEPIARAKAAKASGS